MEESKRAVFSVRLPCDIKEKLRREAFTENVSQNEILTNVLHVFFEDESVYRVIKDKLQSCV